MDLEAEAARDRRQIRLAVIWTVIGTTALIALITGSAVALKLALTDRCPAPAAGIALPR